MKFLGHKLREIRKSNNMTMMQLSSLTGIKQSKLSVYENGKEFPNTQTATKFAEAFNVDLYYFYLDNATLLSNQAPLAPEPIPPAPKTPYVILAERAEKSGFPLEMLKSIIYSWEKIEKRKQN